MELNPAFRYSPQPNSGFCLGVFPASIVAVKRLQKLTFCLCGLPLQSGLKTQITTNDFKI